MRLHLSLLVVPQSWAAQVSLRALARRASRIAHGKGPLGWHCTPTDSELVGPNNAQSLHMARLDVLLCIVPLIEVLV